MGPNGSATIRFSIGVMVLVGWAWYGPRANNTLKKRRESGDNHEAEQKMVVVMMFFLFIGRQSDPETNIAPANGWFED